MEKNKPTILIIDDILADIEYLSSLLKSSYSIKTGASADVALNYIENNKVDLVILKLGISTLDSVKLCEQIQENTFSTHLPIILIAGENECIDQEAGFNIGAVDYITQPFSSQIIQARIKVHIDLKLKIDRLEESTMIDSLTQTPNRRYLHDYLQQFFTSTVRNKQSISFILLDIDYFKRYNEAYGREQGDQCLQMVAIKLKSLISRPHDIVANYGGGQFMLVLPETDRIGAIFIAETIANTLESANIEHLNSPEQRVTASIGVLNFDARSKNIRISLPGILKLLNDTLALAKSNGRNRIEICHL